MNADGVYSEKAPDRPRYSVPFPGRFLDLTGGKIHICCWEGEADALVAALEDVIQAVREAEA